MSQENVEIVRHVYGAAAQRDVATVLGLYDLEVELDASRIELGGLIGRPVRCGHEGLRSFFRELHEAWDDLEYDLQELIPSGEHVISVVTRRGRGRVSGVEVEFALALVWTLRDGKIIRVVWFSSRDEALEAVGLSE